MVFQNTFWNILPPLLKNKLKNIFYRYGFQFIRLLNAVLDHGAAGKFSCQNPVYCKAKIKAKNQFLIFKNILHCCISLFAFSSSLTLWLAISSSLFSLEKLSQLNWVLYASKSTCNFCMLRFCSFIICSFCFNCSFISSA